MVCDCVSQRLCAQAGTDPSMWSSRGNKTWFEVHCAQSWFSVGHQSCALRADDCELQAGMSKRRMAHTALVAPEPYELALLRDVC